MDVRICKITKDEAMDLILGTARLSLEDRRHYGLTLGVSTSIWAGFLNGRLGMVTGIIAPNLLANEAYLWLYHVDTLVYDHRTLFIRHSRKFVRELLTLYPKITGHCTNDSSRWLRWLGANLGESVGELFEFEIRKQHG